jgi:WD40 repeat protein
MAETFAFDVFLSHSSKDKPLVRELAERLKADGLRVWFDEWEIAPGDHISGKVVKGLEQSRRLVVVMTESFFASEWAAYEHYTVHFSAPTNAERRFIPLLAADCEIPFGLRPFLYIDYRTRTDSAYEQLLKACRPEPSEPAARQAKAPPTTAKPVAAKAARKPSDKQPSFFRNPRYLKGHNGYVWSVALTQDGRRALSGSMDNTLKLWDLQTRQCLATLKGHTDTIYSVALAHDGRHALSGSMDSTLKLWDLESRQCIATLEGHTAGVWSMAFSPDGNRALSGSADKTLKLWDLDTRQCLATLEGHTESVWSMALSSDGSRALSGSADKTLRLWDLETGQCLAMLEGHTGYVGSVAFIQDAGRALSGSADNTLKLWDVKTRQCVATLEGHTN